jgi:hypothetical protein
MIEKKKITDEQVDEIAESGNLSEENVEILTDWVEQVLGDLDKNSDE